MFAVFAPLALLVLSLPVCVLVLRVTRPDSRWVKVLWWGMLGAAVVWFAYSLVVPAHPMRFEVMPYRTHVATFLFVLTPFVVSHLLARHRSGGKGAAILVAYCLCVAFGFRALNETCIFYNYHHDEGEAWCAESWQAGWRKRGAQPWPD